MGLCAPVSDAPTPLLPSALEVDTEEGGAPSSYWSFDQSSGQLRMKQL